MRARLRRRWRSASAPRCRPAAGDELGIDLSDTPLPLLTFEDLPSRAGLIIEIGRGINEGGPLSPGIELPTGAVWQPALWIYGSQRIALLTTDGDRRTRRGRRPQRSDDADGPVRQSATLRH